MSQSDLDALLVVDRLHEVKEYQKIFEITSKLMLEYGSNVTHSVLWRHARAYYDLSSGLSMDWYTIGCSIGC